MTEADDVFAPWQDRAYAQAARALVGGTLGHAMLFTGPALLGQRAVAERLAQRALCFADGAALQPCGSCRSCRLFQARSQKDPLELRPDKSLAHPAGHPSHPDAIFLGHAWKTASPARQQTQLVVEQIRALSERLGMTPQYGRAQLVIIDPADDLNESASNALLKTLEEPVSGRYLWLLSADPARLPATIRSRCQRLEFRLPPRDEALQWLFHRHKPGEAAEALDAARGHPGLADAWLRDGGMALRRDVASDLSKLRAGSAAVIDTAQRWARDGDTALRLRHAADLALAEAGGLTDSVRMRKLATWFDAANRTRDLLRTTVRADLAVAELLLAWRGNEGPVPASGARRRS